MTNINAHVLVKNEARFVWFSVMSVVNYVDKVLIYDTGSTDKTMEILEGLYNQFPQKIVLKQVLFDPFDEEKAREQMLSETLGDWFLVVDGDEIWWDDSIKKVTDFIRHQKGEYESIVVPTINLVGDMYHYQEEKAGNYHLSGRIGHYNLRAVNTKIPGLHSLGEHGIWGWVDRDNKMIQDRSHQRIAYVDAPYLHATFLRRAAEKVLDQDVLKRSQKLKHEIGIAFPLDYFYPEVFFRPRLDIVENVWEPMGIKFLIKSIAQTPFRKIKRRVLPKKVGY